MSSFHAWETSAAVFMERFLAFPGTEPNSAGVYPRVRLRDSQRGAAEAISNMFVGETLLLTHDRACGSTLILCGCALWDLLRPDGGSVLFLVDREEHRQNVIRELRHMIATAHWPADLWNRPGFIWKDDHALASAPDGPMLGRFLVVETGRGGRGSRVDHAYVDAGLWDYVPAMELHDRARTLVVARHNAASHQVREVRLSNEGVRP